MGRYKLIDTPSGYKSLVYAEDSAEIKLHSAYDPEKEALRAVESFKAGRSNMIVVSGLALGFHTFYLKKKFPDRSLIIIEKDREVVDIVRTLYPENIQKAFIISSPDDINKIFEDIDISVIRGVSSYIHRPSYRLDKNFYDAVLLKLKEFISSRVSDLLTRFEFEENWINNIFKNAHWLYSAVHVSDLSGRFRNIPGIIVSAGPSLKKNVSLLNGMRDTAVIVCVDTALKVLQKYNVIPHIVMTLDSQKHSLKHFMGVRENGTLLLADMVSYPRIIESYTGGKMLSTTTKYYTLQSGDVKRETTPVWDWMEEFTGPIGDIQSGGSVATSVFDLLLNMGCSPIILVGQDLAYTGREIHCTGTHHNEEWLAKTSRFYNLETINQNVIRKRKIKYMEGYKGRGRVISDFIFDIYRAWFADSALKVNVPVINATEGGARIANTIELSLKESSVKYSAQGEKPDNILKKIIKSNPDRSKSAEKLLAGVKSAIAKLEELKTASMELFKKESISSPQDVSDLIYDSGLSKLINPFMRRIYVYLLRHQDLSPEKTRELLAGDCIDSAKKLIRMLNLCKINLENIRYL